MTDFIPSFKGNIILALSAFLISGCGSGFESKNLSSLVDGSYFQESASTDFIRAGEKLVTDCKASGELCVFLKNPVAQSGSVVSKSNEGSLRALQNFSVKLNGLDRSGYMENAHFDVRTAGNKRISFEKILVEKGVGVERSEWLTANAYFWLNRASEYLKNNFKEFPLKDEKISVYVDDAFNGWSYEQKSIHLSGSELSALSADVVLLLYGEAQIGVATKGSIYNYDQNFHKSCGGKENNCCVDSKGCAKALVQASGDVLVNFLFEDLSGVGEFYHQDLKGQSVCGKHRRPEDFSNPDFNEAYNLCSSEKGKVSAMATAYASCWYGLKNEFGSKKVLEVYLKHLSLLNGSDTFETALQKASTTAQNLGYTALAKRYLLLFPICAAP
ncbi:MAG: hypothetical protein CL676_13410 [Bdellovibrionaceae bacterium]|nr:hypothetical protein [Pseudobdellovibrionaceae bacterium]|tara:strand:- start:28666 stop:29823 length:1158 start_codon:yes stop_codon:yes gene_type:complete